MSDTKKLQFDKYESDHALPLYEESQGQAGPAYLYLDARDGQVWVRGIHPAHASSWGIDEHNGHVCRWGIANNLTAAGINELLADLEVLTRLASVLAGAEEYYDGNNYRTRLSAQADESREDLERYLADSSYSSLEVWDAFQWLDLTSYADLVRAGETHEDAAIRLSKEALSDGIWVHPVDVEKALAYKQERQEDTQD